MSFAKSKIDDRLEIYKAVTHPKALNILYVLKNGHMSFTELMFNSRCSPSVLSKILSPLLKWNFILKDDNKYVLTEKGEELLYTLQKLVELLQY